MLLPASGHGCSFELKTGTCNITSTLASSHHSDSEFHLFYRRKKGRSSNASGIHSNPISLNRQHIIDIYSTLKINDDCNFS